MLSFAKSRNRILVRLLAIVLVLATALPMTVGCDLMDKILGKEKTTEPADTDPVSPEPEVILYDPERITTYDLNAESPVLVTGRTMALSAGLALDLSAASMRFYTTGGGDVSLKGVVGGGDMVFFTIYIDGVRQESRVMFPEGESTQVIASNLSNEAHLIEIVRQTEGQFGSFTAQTVTMKGSLFGQKPAEKKRYIEFIGDSITCGAGCLCKYISKDNFLTYLPTQSSTCIRNGEYKDAQWLEEDATNSYAYLTARELNADCSLVSFSGIGLMRSYAEFGGQKITMPELYAKGAYKRTGGETYDFASARKPDLVVINLGTNDESLKGGGNGYSGALTKEQYKKAVQDFIAQIRASYNDPDLKIMWATGMMNQAMATWTKEAIRDLDDANVKHTATLSQGTSGHGSHPTYYQQKAAVADLKYALKLQGFVK